MAHGTDPATPILSLPNGGGAVQGLGERFAPDPHTGTGNLTIPIALPAGRNGFQPELNLVYSTGMGAGPFGMGWALSVPRITRKTSSGIPRYQDADPTSDGADVFVLGGAEDLVPVEVSGTVRYRPRTEGLFARIEHHAATQAAQDSWDVRGRDGQVSVYGGLDAGGELAEIVDPADERRRFCWLLTRTSDTFGNRIDYLYERDASRVAGPHVWDQVYLAGIRYADFGDPANPQFLIEVRFLYEPRPDPFSDHRAGFEIRTQRRCTRIELWTHAVANTLVRVHHLVYLDALPARPGALPLNAALLLARVQVEGRDGAQSEWLPPLDFDYTCFEPARRQLTTLRGADLPAHSLRDPHLALVDLTGNGLPDIVELNGSARYWRNRGDGRFDVPRSLAAAPAGVSLGDTGVRLIDANGDGRADLLVSARADAGYYTLDFAGGWDRRSFHRYRAAPSFDVTDAQVLLIDLDGDGVTDALRTGSRLECFFNDAVEGWTRTREVARRPLDEFPDIDAADARVRTADMTGDGLTDIVLVHDGRVDYWPNRGHGDWGRRVRMRNSPRFPWGYDTQRILLGDIDGDGLTDLAYVDDGKVTLWINQGGNAWSAPMVVHGTPGVSSLTTVSIADVNGTGVSGVLWSDDATAPGRERFFFLDFTGGIKPYLLCQSNNHMGATTRIAYAPSTRDYLRDYQDPATRWKTPLPFPVQVVARVEAIDALSGGKLTLEYTYHHGYWDGEEREFRGFGRVDQCDSEVFAAYNASGLHGANTPFQAVSDSQEFSPPVLTRSWFHQGAVGSALDGWQETDFQGEFCAESWPGAAGASAPTVLAVPPARAALLGRLRGRDRRDALRALRGLPLRTEVFSTDGGARSAKPWTVTEYSYELREENSPLPAAGDRRRIFFPFPAATRTTSWERGDDPLTRFTFAGDVDAWGQARSAIDVAVPRSRDFRNASAAAAEPYLAQHTRLDYATRDDAARTIVDRIASRTSWEIVNDGRSSVFDLAQASATQLVDGSVIRGRRITSQTIHYYDGPPFQGLAYGQIGDFGALVRSEELRLTEPLLQEAWRSGASLTNPPEIPPCMQVAPVWLAEYPAAFPAFMASSATDPTRPGLAITPAGYGLAAGGNEFAGGYYAAVTRCRYDFHDDPAGGGRGMIRVQRDALGNDTSITYDSPHELLPVDVTPPTRLTTTAVYDYRVLQLASLTDANGIARSVVFTPLGLVAETWTEGRAGVTEGDLARPSVRMEYDFLAYAQRGTPVCVRTIRQLYHDTDGGVAPAERDRTLESIDYFDGYGRTLQTRTQAESLRFGDGTFGGGNELLPADAADTLGTAADLNAVPAGSGVGPAVVVRGCRRYDNKGRPVRTYEPFFSAGWDYEPSQATQLGRSAIVRYDATGRVTRTVNADGSERRIVHGEVPDLADPDRFLPSPWETYTYDANDNAARTGAAGGTAAYAHHRDTPSSSTVDALGRTVIAVQRNRLPPPTPADPLPAIEEYVTRSTWDVAGHRLGVTDPLDRDARRDVYDLTGSVLRTETLDGGVQRTLRDAAGHALEERDSAGALVLRAYDGDGRQVRVWARDAASEPVTLRERVAFGDDEAASGLTRAQAAAANLLGRAYRHYDEAGVVTHAACDVDGNVLEETRQVIADAELEAVFAASPGWNVQTWRVDWDAPGGVALGNSYTISMVHDALGRPLTLLYPQDVTGSRVRRELRYDDGGALRSIAVDGVAHVERIAYDAYGHAVLVALGNGVITRCAHDRLTGRLTRQRSERYTHPGSAADRFRFVDAANPLQDTTWAYDLAGNVVAQTERAPGSGVPGSTGGIDLLTRQFTNDAIYRLVSATGRESPAAAGASPAFPWEDGVRVFDPTITTGYTRRYTHDAAGNLRELRHTGAVSFTRTFSLTAGGNRLERLTAGGQDIVYDFDGAGRVSSENSDRHFEWDHASRLRCFRRQTSGAEPTQHVQYLYGASGNRVLKFLRKQGGMREVTVQVGGIFEHYRWEQTTGPALENNRITIGDPGNGGVFAVKRVGRADDQQPDLQYRIGDVLDNGVVSTDAGGGPIDREEYYPFGETSFGGFARKRYRFVARNREAESGLYDCGARWYSPWLGRWLSRDPAGEADGLNPYAYARQNPLSRSDGSGRQSFAVNDTLGASVLTASPAQSSDPAAGWVGWESIHGTNSRQPDAEPAESQSLLGALGSFLWGRITGSGDTVKAADKPPITAPPLLSASPDKLVLTLDDGSIVELDDPQPASDTGALGPGYAQPDPVAGSARAAAPDESATPYLSPAYEQPNPDPTPPQNVDDDILPEVEQRRVTEAVVVMAMVAGLALVIELFIGVVGGVRAASMAAPWIGAGAAAVLAAWAIFTLRPWLTSREYQDTTDAEEREQQRKQYELERERGRWLIKLAG